MNLPDNTIAAILTIILMIALYVGFLFLGTWIWLLILRCFKKNLRKIYKIMTSEKE